MYGAFEQQKARRKKKEKKKKRRGGRGFKRFRAHIII